MTLEEVEKHCSSWKMEYLEEYLAREVSDLIHDEPDLGSTISLYLSLVILRSSRSYIFLPSISSSGRRHLLVSEARCAGILCF